MPTAARHFEASFHVGRTKRKQNEIVLDGTIFSVKHLLKKIGDNIFARAEDRFAS